MNIWHQKHQKQFESGGTVQCSPLFYSASPQFEGPLCTPGWAHKDVQLYFMFVRNGL